MAVKKLTSLVLLLVGGLSAQQLTKDLPDAPAPKSTSAPAFRFIAAAVVLQDRAPVHRFFARGNLIPMASVAALYVADGLTTSALHSRGYGEINPLARPFVKSSAGTAAYFASSYAFLIGEMAIAHRLGKTHPKHAKLWHAAEHGIGWAAVVQEAYLVGGNVKTLVEYQRPVAPITPPNLCGQWTMWCAH